MKREYGKIIFELRRQKGLTQEQLGKMLNVSYQAISKWENNQSEPDLHTLEKLVEIFDISIGEFFDMAKSDVERQNNQNNLQKDQKFDALDSKFENGDNNGFKKFVKKFVENPWYVAGFLGVFVLAFSLIAILGGVKSYSKERICAMADDCVFSISTVDGGYNNAYGFFINHSGLAVTTDITNAKFANIYLKNKKAYSVKSVVGYDYSMNIAIIQVDIDWSPCLSWSDQNSVGFGQKVYAMSYSYSYSVSNGENYSVDFTETAISKISYTNNKKMFQTLSTSIYYGSVLLNSQAQVIGMITTSGDAYMRSAYPIGCINEISRDNPKMLELRTELMASDEYIISFDANGGVGEMPDQIAKFGKNIVLNKNTFTKFGYRFAGWKFINSYFEDEQSVQKLITPFSKAILVAQWEEKPSYTISFNSNGASGRMPNQVAIIDEFVVLSKNNFTKDGYRFVGWKSGDLFFEDEQSVKNLTTQSNKITLFAQWEEAPYYTISFASNGGSGQMSNQIAYIDESVVLSKITFTKDGYRFVGWSFGNKTFSDEESVINLTTESNIITLTAMWEVNTYKVVFYNPDKSEHYEQNFVCGENTKLMKNQFEFDHYVFVCWDREDSNQYYLDEALVNNLTYENNATINFVAYVREYKYIIRYEYDHKGETKILFSVSCNYFDTITDFPYISSNLVEGNRFLYWIDDAGNKYKSGSNPDEQGEYITSASKLVEEDGGTIVLRAVFEELTYNVKILNTLDNQVIDVGTLTYSQQYQLPQCPFDVPNVYQFCGYEIFDFDMFGSTKTYTLQNQFEAGAIVSELSDCSEYNTNVEIYAIYNTPEYTVNYFYKQNEEDVLYATQTSTDSHYLVSVTGISRLSGIIPKGYEFDYWLDDYGNKYRNLPQLEQKLLDNQYITPDCKKVFDVICQNNLDTLNLHAVFIKNTYQLQMRNTRTSETKDIAQIKHGELFVMPTECPFEVPAGYNLSYYQAYSEKEQSFVTLKPGESIEIEATYCGEKVIVLVYFEDVL